MTTKLQHFCHEFASFKLYPNVKHLQTCFEDVLPRFERVADALPDCFQDKKLLADLESLNESLASGLQINVYGEEDLSVRDFAVVVEDVLKMTPQEGLKSQKVCLNIFVIETEIPKALAQNTLKYIREFKTFILVKDYNKGEDKGKEICEKLTQAKFDPRMIAFGCDELKGKMCCHIESLVVQALIRMSLFLQKYQQISKNSFLECDLDILRSGKVSRAILQFLRSKTMSLDFLQQNRQEQKRKTVGIPTLHTKQNNQEVKYAYQECPHPADIRNEKERIKINNAASESTSKTKLKTTTDINEEEKKLDNILNVAIETLMRMIRCVSAGEFALKLSLPVSFCNFLLCEIDFEKALLHSVSKNNRYHLRKKCKQATEKQASDAKKTFMFDYILYSLQEDMDPVFQKAENVLKTFQPISVVMKKMNHEIFDYLTQTEVKDANDFTCNVPRAPTLDSELRQTLLSIDGVYGVGTVYGQLEIHIDKEKVAKQDTQKSEEVSGNAETETKIHGHQKKSINTKINDEKLSEIKKKIAAKMKKHGFVYPYSLRYVLRKPIPLRCKAEPGYKIRNRRKETGTLGGFCEILGEFYGLTCAHVVGESSGSVKEKLYIHTDGSFELFSDSQNIHCRTEDTKYPLIDIGALKLTEVHENECKMRMKKDFSRIDKIKLTDFDSKIPEGRRVHKFGAATGFTKGVVASADYSSRYDTKQSVKNYIYIIDPDPDWKKGNRLKLQSLVTDDSQRPPLQRKEDTLVKAPIYTATIYERIPVSVKAPNEDVTADCAGNKQNGKAVTTDPEEDINVSANVLLPDKDQKKTKAVEKDHGTRKSVDRKTDSGISFTDDKDNLKMLIKEICDNVDVYVRDKFSVTDNEHCKDLVFGKEGDSGSVICIKEKNRLNYTALSMLSAGVFEVEGDLGMRCFSFNLRLGLKSLIKQMLRQQSI